MALKSHREHREDLPESGENDEEDQKLLQYKRSERDLIDEPYENGHHSHDQDKRDEC